MDRMFEQARRFNGYYGLKGPQEESPGQKVIVSTITKNENDSGGGEEILCGNCLHLVTTGRERIEKNGSHIHTFANPYGNIFEIGCFRHAPGCAYFGPVTSEFTWFKGYGWKLAVCGACTLHLGWVYLPSSGESMFHGLILNRLTRLEPSKHGPGGF